MAAVSELKIGDQFVDFNVAERTIMDFCKRNYHPICIDKKEKVKAADKKLLVKNQLTEVLEDSVFVFSCMLISAHGRSNGGISTGAVLNRIFIQY